MAKKNKGGMDEFDESKGEGKGGRLISILTVIFIILFWLAVFAACIKFDLGGFGSGVLAPLLRDVPIVNKILPDSEDSDSNYSYSSLAEANAKIRELQKQLDDINSINESKDTVIGDLQSEVSRLQEFETQLRNFEQLKRDFDENVVFADNAPDISEYQKYYESIDPDNAADIYQKVLEKQQHDAKIASEADKYAKMEPEDAAAVLEIMSSGDLDLVCEILSAMKPAQSAQILQNMDPATAAKITKRTTM